MLADEVDVYQDFECPLLGASVDLGAVAGDHAVVLEPPDPPRARRRQAQQALLLHPSSATTGPDGSDAVKKILGSVTGVAIGVAELRNRVGTGHGASGRRPGVHPRHAQLAVKAAVTWGELVLDTLADTNAPWRAANTGAGSP